MAGPAKKKAVEKKDGVSSGDESETESYHGGEVIQADFEGRNPEAHDFHGIKQLLQQLFLKAHVNLSQMSDMLIAQTGVGSVLKQSMSDEDEEGDDDMTDSLDVFGITSVVNLGAHKTTPCIKQLFDLVKELSEEHAGPTVHSEIVNILTNTKSLGLLINERFVNIPPKISDPLFTSLMSELDRIKKKDTTYDFDYFIMICKMHKPKGGKGETEFVNAEEEVFDKEAKVSFEFDVQNESDTSVAGKWKEGDVEMIPYRKVLFINGNKFNNIVQQVKVLVN